MTKYPAFNEPGYESRQSGPGAEDFARYTDNGGYEKYEAHTSF